MRKPVVYYTALLNAPLTVGRRARIITINRADGTNGRQLVTTPIVSIDVLDPLMFETENTIYKWVNLEEMQDRMKQQ